MPMAETPSLAELLDNHLADDGWERIPSGDTGSFLPIAMEVELPEMDLASGWGATLSAHVLGEQVLMVLLTLDYRVPADHRGEAAILLSHLNWTACALGSLEMELEQGAIRFRIAHDLHVARPRPEEIGRLAVNLVDRAVQSMDGLMPTIVTTLGSLAISSHGSDE